MIKTLFCEVIVLVFTSYYICLGFFLSDLYISNEV